MGEQQSIPDELNALYWTHPDGHTAGLEDHQIDAILASPVIRRIQAEAIREAAKQLRASSAWSISVDSTHPGDVEISPTGYPTYGSAFAAILDARADRIENATDD